MLNGAFLEAKNQSAALPEDDPVSYKMFLSWLYQDRIPVPQPSRLSGGMCEVEQLCRLFIFAEKYNIIQLADRTMDLLTDYLKKKNWQLDERTMSLCYQLTHQNSKLRLFVCGSYVYITLHFPFPNKTKDGRSLWQNQDMVKLLKNTDDLLADFYGMLRLQAGKLQVDPRDTLPCDYHQHGKNEVCPYMKAEKK